MCDRLTHSLSAIAKKIGQRPMEAGILNGLGNAYRFLGQYQQAIDSYQQALAIAPISVMSKPSLSRTRI